MVSNLAEPEPEPLEAMACLEGLNLASDLYVRKIIIAADCLATVNHLDKPFLGISSTIIQVIKAKKRMK